MQEISTQTPFQFAPALSPVVTSQQNFDFVRKLPKSLEPLEPISRNFYWSWHSDGIALFRDLDTELWDRCEQNPRQMLKQISELTLWQRAASEDFVDRLNRFHEKFVNYLNRKNEQKPYPKVAYFCAEYGVHNSLPNYSGGLGILAGDHLKSSSDLGLDLTAVGLLYRYGFFRQQVAHDGWQQELYNDVFDTELALEPVFGPDGSRLMVSVHIRGREVFARAWLARVGRVSLYLLDTGVPENDIVDRLISGHLYGGDVETRIVQEKVLGIGGIRLLRQLGVSPDVFHLNEGHAAFSTLELAKEYLDVNTGAEFAEAVAIVREKCVFTTHTPVAAGNDAFPPQTLRECFSNDYLSLLKLSTDDFLKLGRTDINDEAEYFGMTPLALRMCRSANGVSRRHGEVSRGLWLKMYPERGSSDEVPITSITNGVHPTTWIAPLLQNQYRKSLGVEWRYLAQDAEKWTAAIDAIDDIELWDTHKALKQLLIAFIRERTRSRETGTSDTINEHRDTSGLFSVDALTIGFARRVAAYKRWDLLFRDVERLLRMVDDPERPVQFVFAGKAHPQDRTAKSILQQLMSINHDSGWQRRAVFIEDYDQEVARYLVQGVDVWLNLPRRPMEASGTSGMKAAMNGILNLSILDGWWVEGFNGVNGFAIGDQATEASEEEMDAADAEALYLTLENEVIPAFYSTDANGVPRAWIHRMKNAISTLTYQFSSDRMVSDYLADIYIRG
jgi:starch phosphorylase